MNQSYYMNSPRLCGQSMMCAMSLREPFFESCWFRELLRRCPAILFSTVETSLLTKLVRFCALDWNMIENNTLTVSLGPSTNYLSWLVLCTECFPESWEQLCFWCESIRPNEVGGGHFCRNQRNILKPLNPISWYSEMSLSTFRHFQCRMTGIP